MGDLNSFPETHHGAFGRYSELLGDGTTVALEIRNRQRPLRGNELVRASMMMQMGRPIDYTVSVAAISLWVGRSKRMNIEVLPYGQYRFGRHVNRSLRGLVKELAFKIAPQNVEALEATIPRI